MFVNDGAIDYSSGGILRGSSHITQVGSTSEQKSHIDKSTGTVVPSAPALIISKAIQVWLSALRGSLLARRTVAHQHWHRYGCILLAISYHQQGYTGMTLRGSLSVKRTVAHQQGCRGSCTITRKLTKSVRALLPHYYCLNRRVLLAAGEKTFVIETLVISKA